MRENPFEGEIYKSYKPICFKHFDYNVEIKIIPGWEYKIDFEATNKDGFFTFYVIYNTDNGYNTKKDIMKKIDELLDWLEEESKRKKKEYEQLSIFDF